MIYFTFVGNHDKIDSSSGSLGAVTSIFLKYKEDITDVFIFVTPAKKDGSSYKAIAEKNAAFMRTENPEINVEFVDLPVSNPVDFDIVYPTMLHHTLDIIDNYNIHNSPKLVNITSGTPTMTTCWVLLQQSGILKNASLVQSFETQYAKIRGQSTQKVNFDIDDFPQIQAPSRIKRQLTILSRERDQLDEKVKQSELDEKFPELIGQSPKVREIKEQIVYDINNETHVLIVGERGVGKQVIADSIWRLYHTHIDTKLTTFDCGTFPIDLVTAELFGYKKGSFTGALQDNPGILRLCDGKMLFLDEIGNLPKEGQNALLRYVNDGEIRQIGSNEVVKVRTQIIAATNKNIHDHELFAPDLKDRFDEIIAIPPLREHKEDIPLLINFFLSRYSEKPLILDDAILNKLTDYE